MASSTITSTTGGEIQSTGRSAVGEQTGIPITISLGGTAIMTIVSSIAQSDDGSDFEADGPSKSPIE